MKLFSSFQFKKESAHISVEGVVDGAQAFILAKACEELAPSSPLFFVANDSRRLSLLAERLAFLAPNLPVLILPGWDCLPYDRASPSSSVLARRLDALAAILALKKNPHRCVILTTANALLQRILPAQHIELSKIEAKPGNSIDTKQLIQWLETSGFQRVSTVRDSGEFAVRGGIIDLFPPGAEQGIRLDFFGETLESIRIFDSVSQRTIGSKKDLLLYPVTETILNTETIAQFRRSYLKLFGSASLDDRLYTSISAGQKFPGMEHWLPCFYEKLETVFDYLGDVPIVFDHLTRESIQERYHVIVDHYKTRKEKIEASIKEKDTVLYHPVPPESLYLSLEEIEACLSKLCLIEISAFQTSVSSEKSFQLKVQAGRSFSAERADTSINIFESVCQYIAQQQLNQRPVLIACWSDGSLNRLEHILIEHGCKKTKIIENFSALKDLGKGEVAFGRFPLESGFETDDLVVIAEQDILGERLIRKTRKRKADPNAIHEVLSLSLGDIVVHSDHGIGRFSGLRTIEVDSIRRDCLEILYADENKLLLPVENIELLSRYGSSAANIPLDRLGGGAWQARKAKLKKRLLEMAGQLVNLAAERKINSSPIISICDSSYDEFVAAFPWEETEDQKNAIQDVLNDLSLGKPMDRLICGDVGFGKTEVALRAAFVTVMQGFQVAVVVPTTLLSRQHFKVFSQRFSDFPIQVEQLSRLISPSKARTIKKDLSEGRVDVVIGSHALLGSSVSFKNLGLLIIDEEQNFGVRQKEYLKELKRNIHVLSLSATPVPRTLQLALSGISELSLIATPPVDRMAVRTFVSPFDVLLIRETLLREKYRGGQSFYVVPRISDFPEALKFLQEQVPEVRVGLAHGKMKPDELEKIMSGFYEREYDVLLSTSIVESGLDVSSANTLIVHRSDMFGLAQLYQLRGRVGRSRVRAYALFLLPAVGKPTDLALQRLKILQSLDTLGAGFHLASHDMELRGAGNLLGEEQSGHIREVGFELYQQMLEEAVSEIKDSNIIQEDWSPQINLRLTGILPETYIHDFHLRLSLYRRIGNLHSSQETESFAAELIDRFGPFPSEVENLLKIVEIKILCRVSNIEKFDAGSKGAVIYFRKGYFSNPIKLLEYINSLQGQAKIRSDQSVVFIKEWANEKNRLLGSFSLALALSKIAQLS